jgi:hypothetical protein
MLHSIKLTNALHCTLPSMHSNTLPISLDDTLLAYLIICSTPSTLPCTPPSMFSSSLPGMLSRTLPITLDSTLPACLTIRSQVSSQDAPKYTPSMLPSTPSTFSSTLPGMHALKDAPNCTRWHTPSLLDCTHPSKLSRRSKAYTRERSQVHSQLHSMTHSQPT